MAVVIASSLRKEHSGEVLYDGVSFKVEREDRLALAGPNGAGKTTLLRQLAGQVSIDGGELALQKGTRIALHDQRPPDQSPRPRRSCAPSRTRWRPATTSRRRCGATRRRRRAWSMRAGTTGATAQPPSS